MKFDQDELAFIDVGLSHWPEHGIVSSFQDEERAYILRTAFVANNNCDPVDVLMEAISQAEAHMESRRRKSKPGYLKSWMQKRIRTNASNAKERTAKQEDRIKAAAETNRKLQCDIDDDPLVQCEK